MFNLNEDNKDVDSIISHLESLIVNLRKLNKLDSDIIGLIQDLFEGEISDYMNKYYLLGVEVNPQYETQIIDNILDLINILSKIK
jgi:hypothetical protein